MTSRLRSATPVVGHSYFLRVRTWERPWWLLGLVGRWREITMEPPPDASAQDVFDMAEQFRELGAEVEVAEGS